MLRDLQRKGEDACDPSFSGLSLIADSTVAELLRNMAGDNRMKVTDYEITHQPDQAGGEKETIKITEVQQGPGPLPPKSSDDERIRITEVHSVPAPASTSPVEVIPTIIPTEPLSAPITTPSVRFAPEHVKETVTEASYYSRFPPLTLTSRFV